VAQQEIDCKALLGKNNRISTDVFFKSSGCTKNQPGIPILRPFRGTNKSQPDCLQVPSREIEVTVRATPLLLGANVAAGCCVKSGRFMLSLHGYSTVAPKTNPADQL
jgi:hypothetical protein